MNLSRLYTHLCMRTMIGQRVIAMKVFIVSLNNEIMSVCASRQVAEWEKKMIELYNDDEVEIRECSIVNYEEEYHNKELDIYTMHKNEPERELVRQSLISAHFTKESAERMSDGLIELAK